jgi:mono/diheme cytochrome c family protein
MSKRTVLALAFCTVWGSAHAANVEHGKVLYQANCTSCHNTSVFTRPDRRVNSLPALEAQVGRCKSARGLDWSDQDIADVVAYLNADFYHFAQGSKP